LVQRARSDDTFRRLWQGETSEFECEEDALYAAAALLRKHQRGYRDRYQLERILSNADHLSVEGLADSDIVQKAIEDVEEFYRRDPGEYLRRDLQKFSPLSKSGQKRTLQKLGYNCPSTDELRQLLESAVYDAVENSQQRVFAAPTSSGKSHLVTTTRWLRRSELTGGEPVVLFVETKKARQEAKERAESNQLTARVLKSYDEACPVAGGKYDIHIDEMRAKEWFENQIKERGRGARDVHEEAEWKYNDTLPCCEGDKCELGTQWEDVPRHEDWNAPTHDLIIACDAFAHVPPLREYTNVIHDEQPSYTVDFGGQDRIHRMVGSFLHEVGAPIDTWEEFVTYALNEIKVEEIDRAIRSIPDSNWISNGKAAHAQARELTRALWEAFRSEFDANGRAAATIEYSENNSDAEEDTPTKRLSVVVDDDNGIRLIRDIPDFSTCRSVIGLDAWPCAPLWKRNVLPDIEINDLLTHNERKLWRLFERELTVVQIGDSARPLTNSSNFHRQHVHILLRAIRNRRPNFSTVGSPKSVKGKIRNLMGDAGIENPELMHLGNHKSRNDFADEPAGLLYGCIDPGDNYILDLLTECGYSTRPEYKGLDTSCSECSGDGCDACFCNMCDGDGCDECDDTGHKRAKGRRFVGEDADKAVEFLESVRECNNAQMIGRWGRDSDTPTVVYSATNALPDTLVDYEVDGVTWSYGKKQRAVVEQMNRLEQAEVSDLENAILDADTGVAGDVDSIEKRTIQDALDRLEPTDLLTRKEKSARGSPYIYEVTDKGGLPEYGVADLAFPNSRV